MASISRAERETSELEQAEQERFNDEYNRIVSFLDHYYEHIDVVADVAIEGSEDEKRELVKAINLSFYESVQQTDPDNRVELTLRFLREFINLSAVIKERAKLNDEEDDIDWAILLAADAIFGVSPYTSEDESPKLVLDQFTYDDLPSLIDLAGYTHRSYVADIVGGSLNDALIRKLATSSTQEEIPVDWTSCAADDPAFGFEGIQVLEAIGAVFHRSYGGDADHPLARWVRNSIQAISNSGIALHSVFGNAALNNVEGEAAIAEADYSLSGDKLLEQLPEQVKMQYNRQGDALDDERTIDLLGEYPDSDERYVVIATNGIANINIHGTVTRVFQTWEPLKNGLFFTEDDVVNWSFDSDNSQNITQAYMYESANIATLNSALGFDLRNLDLETQQYFFAFMAQAKTDTFERLIKCSGNLGTSSQKIFIESFLALEHGDELGEMILNLMENGQRDFVLESFRFIREVAPKIANVFNNFDPEFATQTLKSLEMRITAATLAAANAYLEDPQSTRILLYGEKPLEIKNFDEIGDALNILNLAFTLLAQSFSDNGIQNSTVLSNEEKTASAIIADFPHDPGVVTVQLREYGAPFGEHIRETEFDGEARMNFLISLMPLTPLPNGRFAPNEELTEPSRIGALSIRIDRDGIMLNEMGEKIGSDPTSLNAVVSIDIGGGDLTGDPNNVNARVGKILAIGDELLAKRRGTLPNHYHVRERYDRRFAQPEKFAELVRWFRAKVGAVPHSEIAKQIINYSQPSFQKAS